jgi:hypothetical protein
MLIKAHMQVDADMQVDEEFFSQRELLICMMWLAILIKARMQVVTHMQVEESFSTGSRANLSENDRSN